MQSFAYYVRVLHLAFFHFSSRIFFFFQTNSWSPFLLSFHSLVVLDYMVYFIYWACPILMDLWVVSCPLPLNILLRWLVVVPVPLSLWAGVLEDMFPSRTSWVIGKCLCNCDMHFQTALLGGGGLSPYTATNLILCDPVNRLCTQTFGILPIW